MNDHIAHKLPRDDSDPFRYGIYLRPDAKTCRAVTTVTDQLRAQYGLLSAGAFPPHATLVGSQPFGFSEPAVVDALTELLDGRPAFTVHNAGVRAQGRGYVYDVSENPDGSCERRPGESGSRHRGDGRPVPRADEQPLPNDFVPELYRGHLSLASHDLYVRPDLYEEVGEFIRELDVPVPGGFPGRTVVMYRTSSPIGRDAGGRR